MKSPKIISKPELKSAKKLNALELNALRIGNKHTLLTPELMERMAREKSKKLSKNQ